MNNSAAKIIHFNRIEELKQEYLRLANSFYKWFSKSSEDLYYYQKHTSYSFITELLKNEDLEQHLLEQIDEKLVRKTANIKHYSRFNPLVWTRLTIRRQEQIQGEFSQFKQRLKVILKETKELMEHYARKNSKRDQENYEKTDTLRYNIELFILEKMDMVYTMTLDDLLFSWFREDRALAKHELLQLITINHDRYYWDGVKNDTQEIIAKMPNRISYKEFEKVIFAYKVEHDQDASFFKIFFKSFIKAIDENPVLADKAFETFQETFGPVQTYTTYTDELGNVLDIKPNKPDFKVLN